MSDNLTVTSPLLETKVYNLLSWGLFRYSYLLGKDSVLQLSVRSPDGTTVVPPSPDEDVIVLSDVNSSSTSPGPSLWDVTQE